MKTKTLWHAESRKVYVVDSLKGKEYEYPEGINRLGAYLTHHLAYANLR